MRNIPVNEVKQHSQGDNEQSSNEQSSFDPWAHISGDRVLSNNPWRGKHDRRKKARNVEESINYNV